MSIALREGFVNLSLGGVLEDLLVRFVINCPSEDLSSIERVFFQIEEAQWFYVDFIRAINPNLPNMKMKGFSKAMIDVCPLIWKWGDPSDALARFGKYKSTIPVRGVALFNESLTKILLVQGTESSTWSFPRGKINKLEDDSDCAVRECREETGFDAASLVDPNDYVERTIHGKNYRIYLVKNVPEDFEFKPLVRNEINEIKWRSWKKVVKDCKPTSSNYNNYYLVNSMVKPISNWVNKQKGINDEETLKKYAESQLKILLGIGESKKHFSEAKRQIDAGREILDLLHSHSTTDGPDSNPLPKIFEKLLQPSIASTTEHPQQMSQQNQQPQYQSPHPQNPPIQPPALANGYPLQYLVPLQFYPGVPVFAPSYQQLSSYTQPQFQAAVQQLRQPQPLPQPQLQHQHQYQQPQQQAPTPGYLPVPNPEEFSKPSFSIAEITKKRKAQQSESSKKELLSILTRPKHETESVGDNSEASSPEGNPLLEILQRKPSTKPENNQKPIDKSSELLNILQRGSNKTVLDPKKVTIMRRKEKEEDGDKKQGSNSSYESGKVNKIKTEQSSSADLLSILHGSKTSKEQGPQRGKVTLLRRNNDNTLKSKKEQPTFHQNESMDSKNELLNILKNTSISEKPASVSEGAQQTASTPSSSASFASSFASSSNEFLSVLNSNKNKKQQEPTSKANNDLASNELLSMLNKKSTAESQPDKVQINPKKISILRRASSGPRNDMQNKGSSSQIGSPVPRAPKDSNNANFLLSILNKPKQETSNVVSKNAQESATEASSVFTSAAASPSPKEGLSQNQSRVRGFNSSEFESAADFDSQAHGSLNGSNELLSILRRPKQAESDNSFSNSPLEKDQDSKNDLLSILHKPRSSSKPVASTANNNSGSRELLSFLHKGALKPDEQSKTESDDLLSLLKKKRPSVSSPDAPGAAASLVGVPAAVKSRSQLPMDPPSVSTSSSGNLLSILHRSKDQPSSETQNMFPPQFTQLQQSAVQNDDEETPDFESSAYAANFLSLLNDSKNGSLNASRSSTPGQSPLGQGKLVSADFHTLLYRGHEIPGIGSTRGNPLQQLFQQSTLNHSGQVPLDVANNGDNLCDDDDLSDYIDFK